MTAQTHDIFCFDGKYYDVVGVNGSEFLFDPTTLGMRLAGRSTNCWRGFRCVFRVVDNYLILTDMRVGLQEHSTALKIDGIPMIPIVVPDVSDTQNYLRYALVEGGFSGKYEGLQHRVDFTGDVLLGREFKDTLYVHMGFHPAWKFGAVVELTFGKGELIEWRDKSDKAEEIRAEKVKSPLEPGETASEEEVRAWIDSTFQLAYGEEWG